MNNLNSMIEELLSPIIKKSVTEAIRAEHFKSKKEVAPRKIGGIELAVEITGLAKQTIYAMTSKNSIPHIKRGGKLYFKAEDLQKWIEAGDSQLKELNHEK
jgi:excisionase family DNA binding protein